MSSTELFKKHFGDQSPVVDLKHPNIEKFFNELNEECLLTKQKKMKTQIKVVSEETKKAIRHFLDLNEKFKNAYFFTPPQRASDRRKYEENNLFIYEGDGISLKFEVSCSCKNVYVNKCIKIDGRITNATALKKFVK